MIRLSRPELPRKVSPTRLLCSRIRAPVPPRPPGSSPPPIRPSQRRPQKRSRPKTLSIRSRCKIRATERPRRTLLRPVRGSIPAPPRPIQPAPRPLSPKCAPPLLRRKILRPRSFRQSSPAPRWRRAAAQRRSNFGRAQPDNDVDRPCPLNHHDRHFRVRNCSRSHTGAIYLPGNALAKYTPGRHHGHRIRVLQRRQQQVRNEHTPR